MKKYYIFFLVFVVFSTPAFSIEPEKVGSWNLPVTLTDQNAEVRFEVDSTWHLVKGTTKGVSGDVALAKEGEPSSVEVHLKVPVKSFDTDNSMRDDRMREVMAATQYPEVVFHGSGLLNGCTPGRVLKEGTCSDMLHGSLTLLQTTQEVDLPVSISIDDNKRFVVKGSLPIRWASFGVEDPSIFIAKLNPVATVFFTVHL